jgi:hypothetical protein
MGVKKKAGQASVFHRSARQPAIRWLPAAGSEPHNLCGFLNSEIRSRDRFALNVPFNARRYTVLGLGGMMSRVISFISAHDAEITSAPTMNSLQRI